jgi:6-O-methylguanine DNA methyltransferase, DNA binding domain
LQEDIIADISKAREKFFGCSGKMLLPSRETVEVLLEQIPQHQLATTELIQRTLAAQFSVQVTCPVATRKALQAIAKDSSGNLAFWRVVKKNGELLAIYPGGVAVQAERLTQQGFEIGSIAKKPKVINLKANLVDFVHSSVTS